MIVETSVKTTYQAFAETAAPYLHITDEGHYQKALTLIEELLEETEDSYNDPLNGLIELLSRAIGSYENSMEEIASFETKALDTPADVAMLRLIMDQHGLGVADFPEIGDKSLISRILSGERNLTKKHIEKLADRFGANPGLFF